MIPSPSEPKVGLRHLHSRAAAAWSRNAVSVAIGCAYLGGTAGMLFVSTGIPTILRSEGATFHLLALLTYAPAVWACRVFVAPLIDAIARRTAFGYRALVLCGRAGTLAALAIFLIDRSGTTAVLIGSAAVAVASGIERASLDALAAQAPASHRVALSGASGVGIIAASVFGASLPLLIAGMASPATGTLVVMGYMVVTALPLALTRFSAPTPAPVPSPQEPTSLSPSRPWLMLIGFGVNWVGTSVVFRLGRPLLLDLGTPLARIGEITTVIVPVAGLVGAVLPVLVFRRPCRKLLVGIIVGEVIWCLLLMVGAQEHSTLSAILGMAIGEAAYIGLTSMTTMLALAFASHGRAAATRSSLIDASPYLLSHIGGAILIGHTDSAGYVPVLAVAASAILLSAWPLWHTVGRARAHTCTAAVDERTTPTKSLS